MSGQIEMEAGFSGRCVGTERWLRLLIQLCAPLPFLYTDTKTHHLLVCCRWERTRIYVSMSSSELHVLSTTD